MTAGSSFERIVEAWLAAAEPKTIPNEIHAAVVDAARRTSQRPPGRRLPARHDVLRAARLAVDLAAVIVLAVAVVNLPTGDGSGLPGASGLPSSSPSVTQRSGVPPTPEVHPLLADYTIGRHALTVDGLRLSFVIPSARWEPHRGFHISKSVTGSQGAEGIVFWAGFPEGREADACDLSEDLGRTPEMLAEAVAEAPGVEVISPPSNVILGGRSAAHVVVVIREDLGCDPGYFYTWRAKTGGALWVRSGVGDTYKVWIVDIGGRLLFIGSATHPDAGMRLGPEMDRIVNSIEFE